MIADALLTRGNRGVPVTPEVRDAHRIFPQGSPFTSAPVRAGLAETTPVLPEAAPYVAGSSWAP
jgi:hypothetical protein